MDTNVKNDESDKTRILNEKLDLIYFELQEKIINEINSYFTKNEIYERLLLLKSKDEKEILEICNKNY